MNKLANGILYKEKERARERENVLEASVEREALE